MNGRPLTLAARALTAVLVLATLCPLGSSAGVAEQASAAPPVSSAAQMAGQPSVSATSAPVAASALPASFQGRWMSDGEGFPDDPLILGARTLRWPICGKAARRIKPQVTDGGQQTDYPAFNASDAPQVTDSGPQVLIDLTADGAPPCKLNGQPVTHLRLEHGNLLRPSDVCEMQVTLYKNGPQPTQPQLLGWGVFTSRPSPLETKSAPAETCPQMKSKSN